MEAVSSFDQDDPDVLGHGEGHFLKVLGLRFSSRQEHAGKLADAIHQLRYLIIEVRREQLLWDACILDHVVE